MALGNRGKSTLLFIKGGLQTKGEIMRLMLSLCCLAFLAVGAPATQGRPNIQCSAQIALNHVFSVSVDRQTREMKIVSDSGARWEGVGTYYLSSSDTETFYFPLFVPYPNTTYYPTGMAVQVSKNETWLCIRTGECYGCSARD